MECLVAKELAAEEGSVAASATAAMLSLVELKAVGLTLQTMRPEQLPPPTSSSAYSQRIGVGSGKKNPATA